VRSSVSAPAGVQPARVLGGVDATCIVIGAIVGVGIFFNPTKVAALTGSGSLALTAWIVAGAIALCGALAFAELGGMYNASGAQYEILRDSYGPLPAFLFVFCNATAIQAGAVGIIALVCAKNLAVAAGRDVPEGRALLLLASGLIAALMAANTVGVRWGSRVQNLTVYAKVGTLLVVAALAVLFGREAIGGQPGQGALAAGSGGAGLGAVTGVMAALVPAFFAYGGWQHALWISGEVREPRKNLPRAIVGGVLVVILVYVLANWAYLKLLGFGRVAESTTLAADAVAVVWSERGRRGIAAAVAVSAFGVLNAQLLSGPRLVYAMARDGRFFRIFGVLSPTFKTPVAAIGLIGGMGLVLLWWAGENGIDRLLTGAVFIDGVFFVLTGAALFVLRRKRPSTERPVRVPWYPLVPALFVVGELGVVAGAYMDPQTREAAVIGVAWIAAGVALYAACFRGRERAM
jgi:APA family basic amino acid/polyamine antiporter